MKSEDVSVYTDLAAKVEMTIMDHLTWGLIVRVSGQVLHLTDHCAGCGIESHIWLISMQGVGPGLTSDGSLCKMLD